MIDFIEKRKTGPFVDIGLTLSNWIVLSCIMAGITASVAVRQKTLPQYPRNSPRKASHCQRRFDIAETIWVFVEVDAVMASLFRLY